MGMYTDYPFVELGDTPYELAPIRECIVLSYDGNKYCNVLVEGLEFEIKSGYIYEEKGRCGEVKSIDVKKLEVK